MRFDMAERRHRPKRAGVADENVELAPALVDRCPQPVERVEIRDVAGRQRRRLAAFGADRIVEVLERALGAGEGDDMRAAPAQVRGRRRGRCRARRP